MKTDFNNKFERHNFEFNKIWSENLLVPELIGPNEKFENYVEYARFNEGNRYVITQEHRTVME